MLNSTHSQKSSLKQSKNKVFFLPGAYDGCYYYRGYMPGVYGGYTVMPDFARKLYNDKQLTEKALEADVIVIQRPNEPIRVELAKLLKARGKKVVFDNDDTYLPDKGVPLSMLANDRQREIARKMNENLYEVLKIADLVIASTETLAEEYREINHNVHVIGNFIDPLDEEPRRENKTGKYRIGFIGSVASNDDYIHIKDQLKRLAERGDVTIVVFGIKQQLTGKVLGAYDKDVAFWDSLPNVEWQNFVPITEYYHTITKLCLDAVIIPRKDSYFNRCKSNVKFLEASLLRIPVIAQGFEDGQSPYQGEDEKYMTVVIDNSTWYDTIVEVLQDSKYKALAEKAHDYVLDKYNIKNNVWRWHELFNTL